MAKINEVNSKLNWVYTAGFFIILALPILTISPYFFPADWGKTIVFRSVLAIMLFLFLWQGLYKKSNFSFPCVKNKVIWALGALFTFFLLATIFSVDHIFSLWGSPYRGGGFVTFAFYFVFAIMAFILFKKEDWQKALDFSIVTGILVSLVAIIQYYSLFSRVFFSNPGRPASTMGNPIILGMYLLLLIFIALVLAIKEAKLPKRIFYFLSALVFLYVILISGSRASYLGLVAGGLFFLLRYPKKILKLKIGVIVCLILGALAIFYINSNSNLPNFLEDNKVFQTVQSRLSLKLVFSDPRFYAWTKIDSKILAEKPILGYGPENFSVGFDKYYDPSIPYLSQDWGNWWDRAHNVLFDMSAQAGAPAIIAYLALFAVIFWRLHKLKRANENSEKTMMAHGIQATLIAYLVANFFSFDSFSTYIIFFLLVAYTLHLTCSTGTVIAKSEATKQSKNVVWKKIILVFAFCVLIIFLWQYNLVPFQINAKINTAEDLSNRKQCAQALSLMDKNLQSHSFLDSYARMQYVEFTKTCNNYFPENNLAYIKKGLDLIKEAVKIQPLYTRYWILLGNSTSALTKQESDATIKNNMIKEASSYFDKALQLAPKHQEILTGQAQMEMAGGNYKAAQNYSEKCITLDSSLGECYFYLGLSKIYQKDTATAKKDIETAGSKLYNINSVTSLSALSDAYGSIPDYVNLALVYEQLIKINPTYAQYHSSLAFFYKQLGRYADARKEALVVLQLSPSSKPNVDAFLKTLP